MKTGSLRWSDPRTKSAKQILAGASALAIVCYSSAAIAQDTPARIGGGAGNDAATAIVVTGSRLRTDGSETPIPVTSVGSKELHEMSAGPLIEGVSQLPQFFGNQTTSSVQISGVGGTGWFARGGYGNLNLRGLGINRTLTLLDGHRVISSGPFGGVDINVIPDAMISSVETVTGGASAAYGTDAVAGVVNFKLDHHFSGLVAKAQAGVSSRGDAGNYEGSITFGTNIGERLHVTVSGEYEKQNGIHNYNGRDWYKAYGPVNGQVYPDVVSANSSFNGVIFAPGTPLEGMEFLPNGSGITPFVRSSITNAFPTGTPPAMQSIVNGGSGQDLAGQLFTILPDSERNSIYTRADYDAGGGVKLYAQYIRGENKTFRYNDPTGSFNGTPTTLTIFQDNAFLPASVRQSMIANNIDSFVLRKMGSLSDLATRNWLKDDSVMNSLSAGLTWNIDSGGLFDGWQMDLYYQYGTNKRKAFQSGTLVSNIFASVDAVKDANGNIVCRVSLYGNAFPGCQPINLFGQGNASQAAIDYVTQFVPGQTITTPVFYADTGYARGDTLSYTTGLYKENVTTMHQHVAEFSMNGDVADNWAGTISAAFGGSFRRDSIHQLVYDPSNPPSDSVNGHPVLCSGEAPGLRGVSGPDCHNTVGVQYSKVSNLEGAITVKEAFAEVLVPLLPGSGFIHNADLDVSGRWANYSGSGTVWAYKAGLKAMMGDAVLLRGTYSRDVRAANLSERFDKTGGAATVNYNGASYTVTTYSGGNPNVLPEKADTWTAGVVLKPGFLPGFSVSADYYDIRIKGAIGQLGSQAVLDNCVNSNLFCDRVSFDPTTGAPVLIGDLYINVNEDRVRGLDVEANYNTSPKIFGGDESLGVRAFATWLFQNTETLGSGVSVDRAGQTGYQQSNGIPYALPDFKLTGNLTYRNGGFTSFLQGRYIGPGKQENALPDSALNHVDSVFYLDWRLSYDIKTAGGTDFQIFGMVTNLTDAAPPVTPYYSVFGGHTYQANSTLFDLLGRRFTMGVKVKM